MNTSAEAFEKVFPKLAKELSAPAVFDGVGGELTSRIATHIPANSLISIYGLLSGFAPTSIPPGFFSHEEFIHSAIQQLQQRHGAG